MSNDFRIMVKGGPGSIGKPESYVLCLREWCGGPDSPTYTRIKDLTHQEAYILQNIIQSVVKIPKPRISVKADM